MGLELVAVSLGLCTFSTMLRNKRLVIHCDNKGAEVFRFSRILLDTRNAFVFVVGGDQEGDSEMRGPRSVSTCAMVVCGGLV